MLHHLQSWYSSLEASCCISSGNGDDGGQEQRFERLVRYVKCSPDWDICGCAGYIKFNAVLLFSESCVLLTQCYPQAELMQLVKFGLVRASWCVITKCEHSTMSSVGFLFVFDGMHV